LKRLAFVFVGALLFSSGCISQSYQNVTMGGLMREVGTPGMVLLYGTIAGDVNSFTIETDDGRQYFVSQIVRNSGIRLFYFLDVPRDFTITRIWTESAGKTFHIRPGLLVRWRGRSGDAWINSNAQYIGRIDLRFSNPKIFAAIEGRIQTSFEKEDRTMLQGELESALSVSKASLPAAGQPAAVAE
jgi:hypothetical protein